MKKITLLFFVLFVTWVGAQNYYGTQFIGESGTNNPIATSKGGDKIVLSSFIGGTLTGNFPISFKGGNADGTLVSLSAIDGSIQWIKQFGGGGDEVVVDTAIDAAGNYYLTGYFTGAGALAMDADPGPAVYTLAVPSAFANRDIFIIKLDVNGDFVWAKQMSTPSGLGNDDVATIKVDSDGNIYLAGAFVSVDFDPGPGTQTYVATGNSDAFIVKLDNDGNFGWVKILEGTSNKKIMDMEMDAAKNIYVTGRFQGTIDLNPDSTVTDTRTTAGGFDTFVAKYTSTGDYVWGLTYGSNGADTPEKIIVNNGNVYVGGSFSNTVDLDPTDGVNSITTTQGQDAYVSKFTTDGAYVSSFVIPGTTTNLDVVKDIVIDTNGNFYLSGLFQNITLNSNNYTSVAANADAFYLKLDPSMNFSSIYLIAGTDAQSVPLIQQLNETRFFAIGGSKGNADFDYTTAISPEVPSNALIYTYITKFDFETTVLGINSVSGRNDFKIFPNPATSQVFFQSETKIQQVTIFSMEGKNVLTQDNASGIESVNIALLPKGLYAVQSKDENGAIAYKKLIKQ